MATSGSDLMIHAQDLGIRFGDSQPVLQQVDLQIQANEFVSLVGPSGCGKSTLLRLVAGLLDPTEGKLVGSLGGEEAAFA